MRLLITGATGMLGATLAEKWKEKFQIFTTGRQLFTKFPNNRFMPFNLLSESYESLMNWANPDVVVHCAAITDVDYCENNIEQAMAVNAESVRKFLKYGFNSKLIFISSDSVFPDGIYMATEKNQTSPENIYGKTKEAGEKYIQNSIGNHIAIRTTIVGKNINLKHQGFVEWIINSLKNRQEISLFDDALFTPITIWHLANEIEWIINNDIKGILHVSGVQPISKYDFGKRICEALKLETDLIKIGNMNDVKFKARRSKDQTLSSSFYSSTYNRTLPTTNETVNSIVKHFQEHIYE